MPVADLRQCCYRLVINAWIKKGFSKKRYPYEEHQAILVMPAAIQLPFVVSYDDQFILVSELNNWETTTLTFFFS